MKILIIISCCFFQSILSNGQAYFSLNSVMPNEVYTGFEAQQSIHLKLYNALGIQKNYVWQRTNTCDLPSGWSALVCDCDNCYTVNEYTNVAPGYVIDSCSLSLTYLFDLGASLGTHTTKLSFSDPANMSMQAVSIYLTINNGCSPTGLSATEKSLISIYPIPTSNYITIDGLSENETESIALYNTIGVLLSETKYFNFSKINIDMSSFANGIYFLKVKNKNVNSTLTYKIEKE